MARTMTQPGATLRTVLVLWVALFGPAGGFAHAQDKPQGEGTNWELSATTPRFGSVLFRFEDPDGKLWPTYITGRGAGDGLLTMVAADDSGDGGLVPQGVFRVKGESAADVFAVDHPRTLEPLLSGPQLPPVELTIEQIDRTPKRIVETYEKRGQKKERVHIRFPAKGKLTLGRSVVPVAGLLQHRLRLTNRTPYLGLVFQTTIDGADIGLKPGKLNVIVEALAGEPGSGAKKRK